MFWKKLRKAPLRHSLVLLLLPVLLTITCAELWMTDRDALDAANSAYDRSLLGAVRSIAANISTASGGLSVELPYRLFEFFELTASGQVYFRVSTSDGLVELGSADLPPSPSVLKVGVPVFYDAAYFGESVRLVALLAALDAASAGNPQSQVLIQVAESTQSRQEFTQRFVQRSALRDGAIFALTLFTVLIVVTTALSPLAKLATQVRARRADDLTPISEELLPAEVLPLVSAVNQQIDRTQALSSRQRQFVDDASHQLRTHLTTLHVQADHAIGEAESLAVRQTLEALKTEISRATRSTNQLLALARSDAVALAWQPFDLALLARDVVLTHLPQARHKQIDLGLGQAPPGGHDMTALGDSDLLREALMNLVSNAINYGKIGGEITVLYATDSETWSLGVTDNGPGISELERARLGERFMRGNQKPSTGSGLGLAIVGSIAEKHGGGLRLEQRADGGPGLHAHIWWPRSQWHSVGACA
ncbi:histidine kinase [Rhodoferax koreense]|uniref:histidine kinase n=1 Tax=Rhodoferax koreensis TaxID=1842727 RepID=A0A1P8K0P9_9BURK|nr:sensor histidine kinase [Rhodoferax koreense]APW39580.1 histidine kinase [Rhodoferax koreense]